MTAAVAEALPAYFDFVRRLVAERAAIVLDATKLYLVDARVMPVAARHGFDSIAAMVSAIRSRPFGLIHEEIIEALTTNETSFFRDVTPFEALKKTILPELIQKRGAQRELSIWSAACSSGQELYSIALMLRESFPTLGSWKVNLLGTDYSTQMIERAASAVYNQSEVNRGLPASYLVKYFQRQGLQWRLSDSIRTMTTWRRLNLIEPWSSVVAPMDVVFLRNVLIYFSPDDKKKVLAQVRKVLRPDGCMFLGGAETTMKLDDSFERFPCDGAVCYRLKGGCT
ncbi:MAG: chemotaxis protein CheR [Planctomycetota bacterium]|nr:MAG: chemotaxis protein CheR [Planctomycetota bacterium]